MSPFDARFVLVNVDEDIAQQDHRPVGHVARAFDLLSEQTASLGVDSNT